MIKVCRIWSTDMKICKRRLRISILNLKKKHWRLRIFRRKIGPIWRICKSEFLTLKWYGKKNLGKPSIERMLKYKPLKISTNFKFKSMRNWENFKLRLSKNKPMISSTLMKRSSKNCHNSSKLNKSPFRHLLGIIEMKNRRTFHWQKLMRLNLEIWPILSSWLLSSKRKMKNFVIF